MKRAQDEAAKHGIALKPVQEYHLHPELIDALSKRVIEGLERFGEQRADILVLFSAHSLPAKILEMNDPYSDQLLATSGAVAESSGVEKWQFTWQSAGQTGQPWLGPDILDTLDRLGSEGVKSVLVTPVGFVSDHLEVLYDIDIEAKKFAEERGIRLERIRMLNDDPQYMAALADSVMGVARGRTNR
jgi:ferrochelatase